MCKCILFWVEDRYMFLGPLVGFPTCRPQFLDGLAFVISLGYEADIVDLAVASHTVAAALDEVCVVDEMENG